MSEKFLFCNSPRLLSLNYFKYLQSSNYLKQHPSGQILLCFRHQYNLHCGGICSPLDLRVGLYRAQYCAEHVSPTARTRMVITANWILRWWRHLFCSFLYQDSFKSTERSPLTRSVFENSPEMQLYCGLFLFLNWREVDMCWPFCFDL